MKISKKNLKWKIESLESRLEWDAMDLVIVSQKKVKCDNTSPEGKKKFLALVKEAKKIILYEFCNKYSLCPSHAAFSVQVRTDAL